MERKLPPQRPEPPLLTDMLDADHIPVLSDVIEPAPAAAPPPAPTERRSKDDLRNAAELVLQEVLDEYLPRIEDEIRKRLRERMGNLIRAGKS